MASPATTTATMTMKAIPPSQTQATAIGVRTAADRARTPRSRQRPEDRSAGAGTESPLASGVFRQRRREVLRPEIGPQHIEEHQFGVGGLPQQEIGQPLLAGGPDDQIRIRDSGSGEGPGEPRFID